MRFIAARALHEWREDDYYDDDDVMTRRCFSSNYSGWGTSLRGSGVRWVGIHDAEAMILELSRKEVIKVKYHRLA